MFRKLKKLFTTKIVLSPRYANSFIHRYNSRLLKITFGTQLTVDPNWAAVIVVKDVILDVFTAGKYEIQLGLIPKTARLLRLDRGKVKKHGTTAVVELPKKFKCDLYFVNLKPFENRYWQSDYIRVKKKKLKAFKFKAQGKYKVTVNNPAQAVGLFKIDWGKINNNKALPKLDFLVGEVCSEVLNKKSKITPEEILSKEFSEKFLQPKVDRQFIKYGLLIEGVSVENLVYPKSYSSEYQQEVLQIKDMIKAEEEKKEEEIKEEGATEQTVEDIKNAENNETEQNKEKDETDILIEDLIENSKEGLKQKLEKDNKKSSKGKKDIIIKSYTDEDKSSNYPLSETSETDNEKETKTSQQGLKLCPKCQNIVPLNSEICPNCGCAIKEDKVVESERFCPKCGKVVKEDDLFCECGCYLPPKNV